MMHSVMLSSKANMGAVWQYAVLFLFIVTICWGDDRLGKRFWLGNAWRLTNVYAKNSNNTAYCHTAPILALLCQSNCPSIPLSALSCVCLSVIRGCSQSALHSNQGPVWKSYRCYLPISWGAKCLTIYWITFLRSCSLTQMFYISCFPYGQIPPPPNTVTHPYVSFGDSNYSLDLKCIISLVSNKRDNPCI